MCVLPIFPALIILLAHIVSFNIEVRNIFSIHFTVSADQRIFDEAVPSINQLVGILHVDKIRTHSALLCYFVFITLVA